MKARAEHKLIALDIPAEDFNKLQDQAKQNRRTFAAEIRTVIHDSFSGVKMPPDHIRQAMPSKLDLKLRGKVFGLAMRGVSLSNDRTTGERLATVNAEALEELFGVFCCLTGQDPTDFAKSARASDED